MKWNSWSWIREVEFRDPEVEFVNSWSWIREVEFVKLKSLIREVEIVNSWSWNREFVKLKPWINVVEMSLPVFRREQLWLPVCFHTNQVPSGKGSTLKRKNLLFFFFFFLLSCTPFKKCGKPIKTELPWAYSRLPLSRSLRNYLKYFEISVPRHIRFAELWKKINQTATFHKWNVIWLLELERY